MSEPEALSLFADEPIEMWTAWWAEWQGMPEYTHEDLTPWRSVLVHFANRTAMEAFAARIEQRFSVGEPLRMPSIWFPPAEIGHYANKRYADES